METSPWENSTSFKIQFDFCVLKTIAEMDPFLALRRENPSQNQSQIRGRWGLFLVECPHTISRQMIKINPTKSAHTSGLNSIILYKIDGLPKSSSLVFSVNFGNRVACSWACPLSPPICCRVLWVVGYLLPCLRVSTWEFSRRPYVLRGLPIRAFGFTTKGGLWIVVPRLRRLSLVFPWRVEAESSNFWNHIWDLFKVNENLIVFFLRINICIVKNIWPIVDFARWNPAIACGGMAIQYLCCGIE